MDIAVRVAVAAVEARPDPSQLPGGEVLQNLTDGVMGWALILALVALVVSAVAWALGSNSNNYQYSVAGRRGVVISGLAALLIGAAPAIINFFFSTGTSVN
jgi:type IV secretory pathway VirB2 component (pilin)